MILSDRITGLFLVGLGAAAWWGGSKLPPVPGQQVGPSAFPMVVGAGLVLCGLLIALRIGAKFEEEAEAELAAHQDSNAPPARDETWATGLRALIPPGLLFFYVLAVDRLGFIPTAFVMVLTAAFAFGARLPVAIGVAIGGPIFVHLVFSKLLRVPLPAGLLPMPW
jgi:putative tricarboxylic transport membrane protein